MKQTSAIKTTKKPVRKAVAKPDTTSQRTPGRIRNSRKEVVHLEQHLFSHPHKGQIWQEWAKRNMPTAVYRHFGLLGKGSENWQNVVEHNVFVAAASLTLARLIQHSGYRVKTDRVLRAAMVHDASKRRDVEQGIRREDETHDTTLADFLLKHGYSYEEVVVALNTGRSADRYIVNKHDRAAAVSHRSIEANIVGYVDARTRGARLYSLQDSQRRNVAAKLRAEDKVFFSKYWLPYYKTVEAYLRSIDPDFDPRKLTDEAVYQTVLKQTKDYHRQ